MTGIEHLRRVADHLNGRCGDPHSRFRDAAREFEAAWQAGYASWPLRFRLKSDMIRALLARCPDPSSEDDPALHVAAEQLRRFGDEAERAFGGRRDY